jgi:hypothetical protein
MRGNGNKFLAIIFTMAAVCALKAPVHAEQYNFDHSIMRDTGVAAKSESAGTINKFADAYKSHSRPRVAIFLNRTLSDDVREWKTDKRAVIAGNGSIKSSAESLLHYREDSITGPVAAYEQEHNGVGEARNNASETNVWAFENGFIQPFLKAGVNLVDRATILRLLAQKADQGFKDDVIETKKTEMEALLNYADVYVELLVSNNPSAPTGYEYKAMAKEIKTGRILGSVTSLNWDATQERPKKIITTSKGYEIVDETKMPSVQDISRDLAVDLMNNLMTYWDVN